uniref:tripartite motif-containing protein 14-like n=1 Tax=Myxine glutinosa TaxID=7769 RepID=UPI00358FD918
MVHHQPTSGETTKIQDHCSPPHSCLLFSLVEPTSTSSSISFLPTDGRTPSLDPNSAHREIKISRDLRTATRTETDNPYPEHPDRFDRCVQVLSSDCFSSGRHYWEVDVRSSSSWLIGICLNSMGRKGEGKECCLGGNPESWCLQKYQNEYSTWHNCQGTHLSVPGNPERFGFLLDCEEGEFTCFGDSRVLHVFRGNFMDPVKPAIGVHDVGDSLRFCSF